MKVREQTKISGTYIYSDLGKMVLELEIKCQKNQHFIMSQSKILMLCNDLAQ
jgi:hypothetical protein